jgi:hypothetical protein
MPKRLAITGEYQVDVLDYTDPPLEENQVLVETELASGKHGTTMGMMDNRTFAGQYFDPKLRLFVDDVSGVNQHPPAVKPPESGHDGSRRSNSRWERRPVSYRR